MTYNRIESFMNPELYLPRLQKPVESLFEGPKNFSTLLIQEIERVQQEAERKGYHKAIKDVESVVGKELEKYIFNVSFIVSLVYYFTQNDIKKDIKIKDSRTRFCPDTGWIDIIFIIDANLADEIPFSNLLSNIEREFLQKQNIVLEMFYINERDKSIDYSTLKNDYPFTIKPFEFKP